MLISRKGRFIIATPTRTGTMTLEELVKPHRGSDQLDLVQTAPGAGPRRRYSMVPPTTYLDWNDSMRPRQAYLLVRHPYDRIVSLYHYMLSAYNVNAWGTKWVQGNKWPGRDRLRHNPINFDEFVNWLWDQRIEHDQAGNPNAKERPAHWDLSAYRSPWIFLDTLSESAYFLRCNNSDVQPRYIHLEDLWSNLRQVFYHHKVCEQFDLGGIRANRSTNRSWSDWQVYWQQVDNAVDVAGALGLDDECVMFGYEPVYAL